MGCLFFSSQWLFAKTSFSGMLNAVVIALFVTAVALSLIFGLDVLADMPETGKDFDKAIRAVVQALGILIGFSWEKSFDLAVESVCGQVEFMPEPITKLLLAIILASVVIPAWKMHILPTIKEFEEEEEEEEAREEKEEAAGVEGATAEKLAEPLL